MAFGTPTDGGAAYSASGGATVSPAYPAGIQAKDVLVLIVGQKPSTANGGTVTTPSGWTLRESLTGAGGYGTTTGADVGNTNLWIYTKDVVAGTETGNLSVTVGTNNVCWGLIVRIPGGGSSSFTIGTADGSRTTAPTSGTPFTTLLTNGATAPNFEADDVALWAMCIPTDVLANGFTAPTISSTGTTFGTAVELEEPDSGTGNDIGGYVAYAFATAGSSTAAPTVGVTATGTVTNVRGPICLIRIRDTTQQLTPNRYDNTNNFFSATITQTTPAQDLAPERYDNANAFYAPDVTASGGVQALVQAARFDNSNTFYAQTLTSINAVSVGLYTNTNTFYSAAVTSTRALTPARYDNTNVFYQPTITATGADQNLSPARYDNTSVFYSATVGRGAIDLSAPFYQNTQTFYTAVIEQLAYQINPPRVDNANTFYDASISQADFIRPDLVTNVNAFYAASLTSVTRLRPQSVVNQNVFYSAAVSVGPAAISFQDYAQSGYVDAGYTTLGVLNNNTIFSPASRNVNYVIPARYNDADTFYAATAVKVAYNLAPSRVTNTQTFFAATASIEQFLTPSLVNNQNEFYAANVAIDQFITAPLVTNTNTIYAPAATSVYRLSPARVSSVNAFYGAAITVGPVTLAPSLFANPNKFYKQSVLWWNGQPINPETWDDIADIPAAWDDLPITVKTWTEISVTETPWDSVN